VQYIAVHAKILFAIFKELACGFLRLGDTRYVLQHVLRFTSYFFRQNWIRWYRMLSGRPYSLREPLLRVCPILWHSEDQKKNISRVSYLAKGTPTVLSLLQPHQKHFVKTQKFFLCQIW